MRRLRLRRDCIRKLHSADAMEVVPVKGTPPDVTPVEIVIVEIAAVDTASVERLPDVTGDVELPPMRGRSPDVASVKIATVKNASVERLFNAVSTIEVAPFEEKIPDVANAMVATAREMMSEVANVQMAPLREMSGDSVHVVSPPMANVSCGLRDLTDMYSEVAKIAMAREMLCEIANVDVANLRERLCDSVHVVNGPMVSVSCGLGHLTETYRNVARVAKVYCSLASIAIVFSVAVVVVVSYY